MTPSRFQFTIRGLLWATFWTAVCMWACVRIPKNGEQNFAMAYCFIMIAITSLFAAIGGLTAKPWGMLLAGILAAVGASLIFLPALGYVWWLRQ